MSSQSVVAAPLAIDPLVIQSPIGSSLPSPNSRIKKPTFTTSPSSLTSSPRRKSSSVVPGDDSTNLNPLELEAIAAVHELRALVKDLYASDKLPRTPDLIYLNLTTLEGQAFCVELTALKGWRVSSIRHDCMNGDVAHLELHVRYFDNMHALMGHVSPQYAQKMAEVAANAPPIAPTEIENQKPIDDDVVDADSQTFT